MHSRSLRLAHRGAAFTLAVALVVAGCSRHTPTPVPAPATVPDLPVRGRIARAPLPAPNPKLPPVPSVRGPLQIHVVYPPPGDLIESRDSNFVFGSVGNGAAGLTINGTLVPVWPNGAFLGWVANPPVSRQWYDLVAYTESDTARLRYRVRTPAAVTERPTPVETTTLAPSVAATLVGNPGVNDTDDVVIARPTPTGVYHWFLFPGTTVHVSEYRGDMARVTLDPENDAWVSRASLHPGAGALPRLGTPSFVATPFGGELRLPTSAPPAYLVEEHDRTLALTVYTPTTSSRAQVADNDVVEDVEVAHGPGRTVYRVHLLREPFGYLATWAHGTLTLAVRRAPTVDVDAPLRGRTIAVDPGHPPIGATGPTGLWEPVPTLAVGARVRDLLVARGAHVVMTRRDAEPVALYDRPVMARRANPDAFVSIHLNAEGDGNNPFRTNGSGTYYFWPHSRPLAAAVQSAIVPELGLRNRGVFFQNLAVCRPTWYPAVLAEGLYIIMPDQEAAIRTPEYQEAYARGIVNGLENYFRDLAQ